MSVGGGKMICADIRMLVPRGDVFRRWTGWLGAMMFIGDGKMMSIGIHTLIPNRSPNLLGIPSLLGGLLCALQEHFLDRVGIADIVLFHGVDPVSREGYQADGEVLGQIKYHFRHGCPLFGTGGDTGGGEHDEEKA